MKRDKAKQRCKEKWRPEVAGKQARKQTNKNSSEEFTFTREKSQNEDKGKVTY